MIANKDEETEPQLCPDSFYENASSSYLSNLSTFCSYIYSPSSFVKKFNSFVDIKNFYAVKDLRILIQHQTIHCCRKRNYFILQNKKELDNNLQVKEVILKQNLLEFPAIHSQLYKKSNFVHEFVEENKSVNQKEVEVKVINGDCIDIALYLQDLLLKEIQQTTIVDLNNNINTQSTYYPKVAVLNMANPSSPGGGYLGGCGAQEENLHRRSNLYQCLDNRKDKLDPLRKWDYPIGYESGVYSPNVLFFRGNEKKGYPFFKTPKLIDVITAAAVPNRGGLLSTSTLIDERNEGTIEVILRIAVKHNIRNLVLSALGCGAFKNDPSEMSKRFFKLIYSDEFKNCFDRIYFAIIEDHNSHKLHNKEGNIKQFGCEDVELQKEMFDYDYESMNEWYEKYYENLQ
ncbi:hypothetical protein ABK040_003391 [Willaertia magna]